MKKILWAVTFIALTIPSIALANMRIPQGQSAWKDADKICPTENRADIESRDNLYASQEKLQSVYQRLIKEGFTKGKHRRHPDYISASDQYKSANKAAIGANNALSRCMINQKRRIQKCIPAYPTTCR